MSFLLYVQVPELAGFWLLTLLIQLPLDLFLLLNDAAIVTPFERSVTILMTIFYGLEVLIGYFAIRTMVNYQVTKFHMQQFVNLDQIRNPYGEQETFAPITSSGHGYRNAAYTD